MKGVILAAGRGSRISEHNGHGSKVLLRVEDNPLIDYALSAFQEAGVTEVAVVVGHEAAAVMRWVGDGARYGLDIEFIFNPDYPYGNARSVYAAYCDCREAGAEEEALQVLEGASCVLEHSEDSPANAARPGAEEQS